MDNDLEFAEQASYNFDSMEKTIKNVVAKGFNAGLIVFLIVGRLVLAFLVANYALYVYAQKTLPPKKKKVISKKKLKRERMKQGVFVPGE